VRVLHPGDGVKRDRHDSWLDRSPSSMERSPNDPVKPPVSPRPPVTTGTSRRGSKRRSSAPPLPRQHRDGTRTWRTRDLLAQLDWLNAGMTELEADCETVLKRAVADHDDGTSSGSGPKVAGGHYGEDGAENGRVPSMVLARAERGNPIEQAVARLVGRVITMRAALHDALADAAFLKGLDPELARELVLEKKPTAAGRGDCENPSCRRFVPGTPKDRLRSGRCDACRKWRINHAGEERPREVCHPELRAVVYGPEPGDYSRLGDA
jgi:hypothetical protein